MTMTTTVHFGAGETDALDLVGAVPVEHLDARLPQQRGDLLGLAALEIVIAEYGVNAQRRSQFFQDWTKLFGRHAQRIPTAIAGNKVAHYRDQFRLQSVRPFDDRSQLLLVDKLATGVNV